ncbi:hypothetical protein P4493_05155 [Bacillus thuringiensis]|nr:MULTISPECIES: hypothetical protein [Bacillus]MEC2536141.1 hypothetical protein [Bacillus cereus]MCC4011916.1 hypothetical protein [Bacillus thuringiensis]MCC4028029.1 hypothetical protein [Bacillus thuringiensis]MEB4827516.1 hypothetical protein [Bacillus thuringiensis]MEC2372660.1 hypothetical protein [Bacillus thuringiensis]
MTRTDKVVALSMVSIAFLYMSFNLYLSLQDNQTGNVIMSIAILGIMILPILIRRKKLSPAFALLVIVMVAVSLILTINIHQQKEINFVKRGTPIEVTVVDKMERQRDASIRYYVYVDANGKKVQSEIRDRQTFKKIQEGNKIQAIEYRGEVKLEVEIAEEYERSQTMFKRNK